MGLNQRRLGKNIVVDKQDNFAIRFMNSDIWVAAAPRFVWQWTRRFGYAADFCARTCCVWSVEELSTTTTS